MVELISFKTNAAHPGPYFAGSRICYHNSTLHHLPAILNRIKRRHYSIFLTIAVPCKNFHGSFFSEACPNFFFSNPLICHVLPAITFLHIFFQVIFMTLPYCL